MICITRLRQRSTWLLLLTALVLSLSLAACGEQANASNTHVPNNSAVSQQQHQSTSPAPTENTGSSTNLQSTDQQVQRILGQLDGARNDVNNSDAASSQDNAQQP
jgi:peptidoglycan hydrolase CwlO-like protein